LKIFQHKIKRCSMVIYLEKHALQAKHMTYWLATISSEFKWPQNKKKKRVFFQLFTKDRVHTRGMLIKDKEHISYKEKTLYSIYRSASTKNAYRITGIRRIIYNSTHELEERNNFSHEIDLTVHSYKMTYS
jgi:hypothetical protein